MNYQSNIKTVFNNNSFDSIYKNNNEQFSEDIQNDDLFEAYIGKKADKLTNDGFSINTFIFGILYVLYRKMWLLALVWLVVSTLSILFLKKGAVLVITIMNVIFAITFKHLYINHVERKISKIKNKYSNKTKEELIMICRKKGGTTIISVIIYILLFYLIVYLIDSGNMYNLEKIINLKNTSNGTISQTGIIDNLDLEIPDSFVESKYNTDDSKNYSNNGKIGDDLCSLRINRIYAKSYDNSAKKYLDKNCSIVLSISNYDTSGIKKKKINHKSWYYELYTSDSINQYIYSVVNNNYIYTIQFVIYSDNNNTCYSAYNSIINSLNFK